MIATALGRLCVLLLLSVTLVAAEDGERVNFTRYFPSSPGLVMTFASRNLLTGVSGTMTITLEPATAWCGIPVIPWYFRKTHPDLYWGPGTDHEMRWMIVDPRWSVGPSQAQHRYLWALGHYQYMRGSTQPYYSVLYRSPSPWPAYILGKRSVHLPFVAVRHAIDYLVGIGPHECPQPQLSEPHQPPGTTQVAGAWQMRMVRSHHPAYADTIRIDYLEGSPLLWGIREQWTFARDIGVVQILSKQFSGAYPAYEDDPDGTAETMQSPHTISTR